MRGPERRKMYFIKNSVQGRYLRFLVISMALPALFVGGALLYLMFVLLANQMGIPENIHANLIPVMKKILLFLGLTLPVLFGVLALASVYLSHHLAGPLFRLENDLQAVVDGEWDRRVTFRKKDQLESLSFKLNAVLDQLEDAKKAQRKSTAA